MANKFYKLIIIIVISNISISCNNNKTDANKLQLNISPRLINLKYANQWEFNFENKDIPLGQIAVSHYIDSINNFLYFNNYTKELIKIDFKKGIILKSILLPDSLLIYSKKSSLNPLDNKYLIFKSFPVLIVYDFNLNKLYDFYLNLPLKDRSFIYENPNKDISISHIAIGEFLVSLIEKENSKEYILFSQKIKL